jgi:2-(1,2-epoxy-1,2-dihydrophenyl)acetyl-CoA isomerase
MTGEFIDAETAMKQGLINCVVPDDELEPATLQLAAKLAGGPTAAIARIKNLLNQAGTNSYATQLQAEFQTQLDSGRTNDFLEGIAAFLEKRVPEFTGE